MIYSSPYTAIDIPDDVDLYGFFFDYWPSSRPDVRGSGVPLLIDEETGTRLTFEDIHARADALSLGLAESIPLAKGSVISIVTPNHIDFLPLVLGIHRIGAIVAPANPMLSADELLYQLRACRADAMFVIDAEPSRSAGCEAAKRAGISEERIFLVEPVSARMRRDGGRAHGHDGLQTLEGLVGHGRGILDRDGQLALLASRAQPGKSGAKSQLAFLNFSSGTSGLPKGVCISHQNPIANVLQHCAHLKIPSRLYAGRNHLFEPGQDRALCVLPVFHIFGLVVNLLTNVWAGIGVVCVPRYRGTEALLHTTIKYRVTHWYLVPPIIVNLLKDAATLSSAAETERKLEIKWAMSGAAPLRDDLTRAFMGRLPTMQFAQGFGLTETSATVCMSPADQAYTYGSAGVLVPNTEARVIRPDGSDAGPEEEGELWVRGPQISMGYLNDERETEHSYLPGGWFRTGDEVFIRSDGIIFIVDRLKEMIKVKGMACAPAELEQQLLDSDDVLDAGVVGMPDEENGELPLAFVSLSARARDRIQRGGGREEEKRIIEDLKALIRAKKAKYKHLADVVIVSEIPKTPSGKTLRKELKRMVPTVSIRRGRGAGRL
ncbi:hypothetical protein OC846_004617 [Tilletia horrida]|uniref:Acetyl-CoA synthetase-like protein n=1 Tax=Tilletia horrida TaxID=155126 RepID=A0AAN6GLY9_9BASI|nr:hypothetical protein OC846_004617 [Tilletia horrida]